MTAEPPVKDGSLHVLFATFAADGGIARPTTVTRTCRTAVGVALTSAGSVVTVPVPAALTVVPFVQAPLLGTKSRQSTALATPPA